MNKSLIKNSKVTYTPDGIIIEGKKGLFNTARLMWLELISARELIWRLFARDFSAKYRQSALGIVWAVIMPIITVGMFVGVSNSGILNVGNVNMPYPLYALIGLSIWTLFSTGIVASSQAIVGAGTMVTKVNFPKVALIVAATGQSLVDFLVKIALITILFFYYGLVPSVSGVLYFFLALIPLFFLVIGFGFMMSLIVVVVRDVINILNLILTGLMFLTPVLYSFTGDSLLAQANYWNPLNYLVNVPRDLLVKSHTDYFQEFAFLSLLALVIFFAGWRIFYLGQTKIVERL